MVFVEDPIVVNTVSKRTVSHENVNFKSGSDEKSSLSAHESNTEIIVNANKIYFNSLLTCRISY